MSTRNTPTRDTRTRAIAATRRKDIVPEEAVEEQSEDINIDNPKMSRGLGSRKEEDNPIRSPTPEEL